MQVLADASGKFNTTLHRNWSPTRAMRLACNSKESVAFAVPRSGSFRHSARQFILKGENK